MCCAACCVMLLPRDPAARVDLQLHLTRSAQTNSHQPASQQGVARSLTPTLGHLTAITLYTIRSPGRRH